jgi:hypothetical protein
MRISPMMGWCGIPPSSDSCHEHDPGNCSCVSWPHHAFVVGRYLFWDKIGAARVWAPERTLHLLPSGGRGVLVFEAGLSGRNGHLCPSRTRAHAGSPWCNRHGSRQAIRGRGRGQDWDGDSGVGSASVHSHDIAPTRRGSLAGGSRLATTPPPQRAPWPIDQRRTCRLVRYPPIHKEYKESPGRAGTPVSVNKGETLERPESL